MKSRAFVVATVFLLLSAFLGVRMLILDPLASRPIRFDPSFILLAFLGFEIFHRNSRARIAALVLLVISLLFYLLLFFGIPLTFSLEAFQVNPFLVGGTLLVLIVLIILLIGKAASREFSKDG